MTSERTKPSEASSRVVRHLTAALVSASTLAARADAQVTASWSRSEPSGPLYSTILGNSVVLSDGSIVHAQTRVDPAPGVSKDVVLARYGGDGTTQWTRTFSPANATDTADDLELDPTSGDLLLVGVTRAPGATNDDARLSRFDAQGTLLWTTTYATATDDWPRCVRGDANGTIWVLGQSPTAPATFLLRFTPGGVQASSVPMTPCRGELGMELHPSGGVAVMQEVGTVSRLLETSRIDAAGTALWTKSKPCGGSAAIGFFPSRRRIVCDAAGDVFVSNSTRFSYKALLVKYDAAGTELWARDLHDGTNYFHWPISMAVDAQGACVLVGLSEEITISEFGFIMRCDANGNVSWWHHATPLDPLAAHVYTDVALDARGDAFVVGTYGSPTGAQGMVARYTREGSLRDALSRLWSPYSYLVECVRAGNGDFFVTGFFGANALTARLHEQGVAFCVGDGSAGACPCGNTGATYDQSGCRYNAVDASRLVDAGSARIGADSLVLELRGAPPSGPVIFVQGDLRANGGAGVFHGDGLLCVGGNLTRLGTRNASGGIARLGASGTHVSALGNLTAPGVFTYQAIHRSIASFCTPAALGTSNGLELTWAP